MHENHRPPSQIVQCAGEKSRIYLPAAKPALQVDLIADAFPLSGLVLTFFVRMCDVVQFKIRTDTFIFDPIE